MIKGNAILLIWCMALPVVAGTIGAPFLVNPELVISAQPSDQYDGRATSNGSNVWLVTWSDTWNTEIQGLRLDAQGRSLDATPLPIAPQRAGANAFERRFPSTTWQGDAFWVVWQERVYAGIRQGYGRRIAADGRLLDPEPFPIEDTALNAYYPSVCGGASSVLTTWSVSSSGYRLWARIFTPEGQPVGVSTQVVSGLLNYTYPGVAFGNFTSGTKSYLVTYSLGSRIRGTRIGENGVALDDAPLAISTNASTQSAPCPAFGRGPGGVQGWWVIWTDTRNGNNDIYGAFVGQDGSVSHSSTGLPIIVEAENQSNPSLTWDGVRYLLGWYDYRSPLAVRASAMDAEGVPADPGGAIVSTNNQYQPMVCALNEGRFLAVHGSESVFTEVVTASGSALSIGTQRLVSVSGAQERYNDGACAGSNYWVVFEYHPAQTERMGDIALQHLAVDGVPLLASPILACTNSADQWGPSIAVGQDTVYAVWTDERNPREQIWGQRLTHEGQLLGTNVQIGTSTLYAYFCDVASDGTNALTVWSDSGGDRMQGRFLRADGSMSAVITPLNYDISDPFVVFGGGCYLILAVNNDSPNYVRFRRYRPDEGAIDGGASNLFQSASPCWDPCAGYNPDNGKFLVTWRDQATYQILGRTLDASTAALGNVVTAAVLSSWSGAENYDVSYDGTDWLCLFRDTRGGLTSLCGVRVQGDGTVLDSTPFVVLPGGRFGALAPPVMPLTNTLILGTRQVYRVQERGYNTAKSLGLFWQPGAQEAPGPWIESRGVQVSPSGQATFEFRQAAPASTSYVVEACASLAAQDWQALTNCVILDSGAAVSATWPEPGGAATQRVFRAKGW